MTNIPYAITYKEWQDTIDQMTNEQAGALFKALLTETFEERDIITEQMEAEKTALSQSMIEGKIDPQEWVEKMEAIAALSVYWSQMKAVADKTAATYKRRSAANSENGKKHGKGKSEAPVQSEAPCHLSPFNI